MNSRVASCSFFLFASAAPLLGQVDVLYYFEGEAFEDRFGSVVRAAGDCNGDGVVDLIVGRPGLDALSGSALVYSGADGSLLFKIVGAPGAWTGAKVGAAGDVNADGLDDVLVGSIFDDAAFSGCGVARVHSGLDGSVLHTIAGSQTWDRMGSALDGLGDLNGDGYDDFLVGAWGDDTNGSEAGMVRVHSGLDATVLFTFLGDSGNSYFGYSGRAAGDVNGDGVQDIIVGASYDDTAFVNAGSARVFSGATGAVLHTFYGRAKSDHFGIDVDGAGDVNGDGFADLIVGAPEFQGPDADDGEVTLFSGLDGSQLYFFEGNSYLDRVGWSVAGVGDFNGDGRDDFAIGAPGDSESEFNAGSASVHSGVDGSRLFTFDGTTFEARFGTSIDGLGDLNGDSFDDLVVGAPRERVGGVAVGSVWVFAGTNQDTNLGTSYCQVSVNSTGAEARVVASGLLDVGENHLVLRASPVPNGFGIFFYGPNPQELPFGNGFRCVGGHIGRLGIDSITANLLADEVDLVHPPSSTLLITPGSTWYFQGWFRDTGVGAGFNLTDGLRLTFDS